MARKGSLMSERNISVDIVLPVCNEEHILEKNTLILLNYLSKNVHFSWRIVIADNGSKDRTAAIGKGLAGQHERIVYRNIHVKGRGRALRNAFLRSTADIVAYMDVDLSTNIRYFRLLIEGILCGYDIAIGSRLMQGSRIKRKLNREICSHIYNFLIKILFFNRFSDAQCGFKAFRTRAIKPLILMAENKNWFFDTELLLMAEYNKMRIFEVPVEWIEDIRTKVHIPKTIIEDLAGLVRMRFTLHKKKLKQLPIGLLPEEKNN